VDRVEARALLGLPTDAFLVGHFGYITKPKQPAAVVGGFARLARRRSDAQLLMVGADNSGGGLDRLIDRTGVRGRVRATGYVGLTRFYLFLKAVDAVVNLRYPSAGESSGTVSRALAEGRATIVNDLGSFAEIPDGATLKVEVDGDQPEEVGAHLIRLAEDPAFREGVERAARRYAATELDPIRCRDLYVEVARSVALGTGTVVH
jgi:glycosyltransferase involved in cell wall biosynthesis